MLMATWNDSSYHWVSKEVQYHNFYKMIWGLIQYSCFPLQSFVFILCIYILYSEKDSVGITRERPRHSVDQDPSFSGRGGSGGLWSLWIPLPLLGTVFFRATSFLTPVSWPLTAPGLSVLSVRPCCQKLTRRAVLVSRWGFALRPCRCSLTVSPWGAGATGRCLASSPSCPPPLPQSWHSVLGCWEDDFVQSAN